MQKPLLAFVDDVYEDLELWYPRLRLEEAGFAVRLTGPEVKTYKGKHGYPAAAELTLNEARSTDFGGLIIPGGFMPDKLRRDPKVLALTREFHDHGKMVAFICHGGWIPISARILKGKRATGSRGIKDDLENAGALWVDAPVVLDGNLISSRTPEDLPEFALAMVQFLAGEQRIKMPPAVAERPTPERPSVEKELRDQREQKRNTLELKRVMMKDFLK